MAEIWLDMDRRTGEDDFSSAIAHLFRKDVRDGLWIGVVKFSQMVPCSVKGQGSGFYFTSNPVRSKLNSEGLPLGCSPSD